MKKKIFIFGSSGGIGDVLMLFPLIKYLLQDPKNEVTVSVSYPYLMDVFMYYFDNNSYLKIIIIPTNLPKNIFFTEMNKLRKTQYHHAYFPTSVSKIKIFFTLIFIFPKCIISSLKSLFIKPITDEHKIIYYSRKCGINISLKFLNRIKDELKNKSKDLYFEMGSIKKYIVIAPGSSPLEKHKRWPTKNYVDYIIKLQKKFDFDVVLLGGPDEVSVINNLYGELSKISDIKIEIRKPSAILDSIAIINNANMLVSGCCSAIHMGSLCSTKIFGIYGPTDEKYTGPWNGNYEIIKSDLKCAPCYNFSALGCGNPVCIDTVDVEKLYQITKSHMEMN